MQDVNEKKVSEETPAATEKEAEQIDPELAKQFGLSDKTEEATEDGGEEDEGYETDENGDIILANGEAEESEESEEAEETEETEETDEAEDAEDTDEPAEQGNNAEVESLRNELAKSKERENDVLERAKEALKALGYEGEDVLKTLTRAAAETKGITEEEYEQRLAGQRAQKSARDREVEALSTADVAEIKKSFPGMKYNSVFDFPNAGKFMQLRDSGFSPKEAFIATHSDEVIASVSESAKQSVVNNKAHLQSNVPKASHSAAVTIPRSEMATLRECFPDKSDSEIIKLYKQTMKN